MRRILDLSLVSCVAVGLSLAASPAPAAAPGGKAAERLFQEMEAKLSKATSLDLSFDMTTDPANQIPGLFGVAKLKGTLAAMSGNRVRWETMSAVASKPFKRLMISNGTRTRDTIAENGKPELLGGKDTDTPKNLTAEFLTLVARPGLLLPQGPLPDDHSDAKDRWGVSGFILTLVARPGVFLPQGPLPDDKADAKESWGVSGLKLGAKEKDGERELQPLEYQLSLKGQNEPFSATVWIDLKTGLPVKRRVTSEVGEEKMVVSETYGKLTLDEKADAKTFELPK
jgi:outer membrane lipoprotein-sorting protein